MADKRGTSWRKDATDLERRNAERIHNPMKSPPNDQTSIDKAHASVAKSDEGRFDPDIINGGDDIKA